MQQNFLWVQALMVVFILICHGQIGQTYPTLLPQIRFHLVNQNTPNNFGFSQIELAHSNNDLCMQLRPRFNN